MLSVSEGGGTARVMVGPLRGPEHLAVIHQHGYYHVPVGAIASARAAVDYVAFYEGAGRFGHRTSAIREYAPVVRVSRVFRKDLPGLTWPASHDENAPYYRFDLGPIQALQQPITNTERLRVVFRFLDIERLRQAGTIRELGTRR